MSHELATRWCFSHLYHVTPTANMESIRRYGLLLMSVMQEMGITPVEFASTVESRKDDWDLLGSGFVYLSLHPGSKMFWNVVEEARCGPLTIIEVSVSALSTPFSVFSDRPSNRRQPIGGRSLKQLQINGHQPTQEHIDRMTRNDQDYIRYAEVLIPNRIDPQHVVSESPWQRDQYSFRSDPFLTGLQ